MIDATLAQYATPRELEYLTALDTHGSQTKAAAALKVNRSSIQRALRLLDKRAALSGYAPAYDLTHPVAPGQRLRGASHLYKRGEAEPVMSWVKSSADDEAREAIQREAIKALASELTGLSPFVKDAPEKRGADLLAIYPFGDPHFGLYSWGAETGDDFDITIAKRLTTGAVDRLLQAAPRAETAILLPLGDTLHINDQTNATPGHKHQLDADGRFVKVLQVTIQTFRHAILRCLERHKKVIVRFVHGNHDPQSTWALAYSVSAYFDNNPRVEVDMSPAAHWFYRFGKVLIGATHGDKSKVDKLLGVMACDRAVDWGQTSFRYWYTGHIHHQTVTELAGVTCESFRTLAPADAYAASHGYRAGRDMRCIVMHREYGEIERHRVDVGMID